MLKYIIIIYFLHLKRTESYSGKIDKPPFRKSREVDESNVQEFIKSYCNFFNDKDINSLLNLFADDVIYIKNGQKNFKEDLSNQLEDDLTSGKFKCEEPTYIVSGDFNNPYIVANTYTTINGAKVANKIFSIVLRLKSDGDYEVVLEHVSDLDATKREEKDIKDIPVFLRSIAYRYYNTKPQKVSNIYKKHFRKEHDMNENDGDYKNVFEDVSDLNTTKTEDDIKDIPVFLRSAAYRYYNNKPKKVSNKFTKHVKKEHDDMNEIGDYENVQEGVSDLDTNKREEDIKDIPVFLRSTGYRGSTPSRKFKKHFKKEHDKRMNENDGDYETVLGHMSDLDTTKREEDIKDIPVFLRSAATNIRPPNYI